MQGAYLGYETERFTQNCAVFYRQKSTEGCDRAKQLVAFDFFFARNSFAGLVAYSTARLASRLAGASAFTASGHFLFCGFRNRLNHSVLLIFLRFCCIYYNTLFKKLQALSSTFFEFSPANLPFFSSLP